MTGFYHEKIQKQEDLLSLQLLWWR